MSNNIHPFVAARSEAELLEVKKQVHDGLWADVRSMIERAIDSGETQLSRVLKIVEAEWRDMTAERAEGTAYGERVALPRSALIGGRQSFRNRTFVDACRSDTNLILELGSGWGNNLAEAFLAGAPRNAAFVGLELSEQGRACTNLISSLEGGPASLSAYPFNYFEPDYSALPSRHSGHALVFTCHSIEQVQLLKAEVLTKLLERLDRVTGVHHEPVGWQVRKEEGLKPATVGATQENSARSAYNENFWEVLKMLEAKGSIKIKTVCPDILGHKHKNASTLIVWESV